MEIEKYDHHGLVIKMMTDDHAGNPRTEFDNVGKMICWHRRADLGDETVDTEDYRGVDDMLLDQFGEGAVILPLWLYEHSGMTMGTCHEHAAVRMAMPLIGPHYLRTYTAQGNPFACRWDSGLVGFIGATAESIAMEWGADRKGRAAAARYLRCEVETYDVWLRGAVCGYDIETDEGEFVDSCWGFYEPYDGYPLTEARGAADAYLDELQKALGMALGGVSGGGH